MSILPGALTSSDFTLADMLRESFPPSTAMPNFFMMSHMAMQVSNNSALQIHAFLATSNYHCI